MATSLSASAASTTYLSTTVSEPANDIAVADDGSMAVSQHDAQTVVLLSAVGVARSVDIGCKTSAVEIAPDGSTVWAVCQNSPALAVIDVATGQVSMAGMNLTAANDVVYVPALKRLYIADLDGMIVVVSVQNSADYAVLQRVSTPSFRPSWIAPTSAGTTAYVTTDDGRLIAVDMTTSSVTNLSPTGQYLMSLALGLDETHLYAGAVASGGTSAILELNPLNGQILQATALTYTFPGSSTISVAVGYQSMSVATGLGIVIDGEESGMFDIALDAKGAMGAISNAVPGGGYGSGVDRSASGQRAAFAGTAGQVIGLTISCLLYTSPSPRDHRWTSHRAHHQRCPIPTEHCNPGEMQDQESHREWRDNWDCGGFRSESEVQEVRKEEPSPRACADQSHCVCGRNWSFPVESKGEGNSVHHFGHLRYDDQ